MDFTLDDELDAVRGLAGEIFTDRADPARIREVETSATRMDGDLWAELGKAGLLGVALPEEYGGAGLGLGALCVLLEEQGRHVAPVPIWPATVAALAIAAHGTPEQRAALLPGAVDGSVRLTAALEEFGPHEAAEPECAARPDGDGWRLTGVKAVVPTPAGAACVLVSARAPAGPGLFLVAADAPGVAWEPAETTARDLAGTLTLTDAPAQAVGGALGGVLDQARVAVAALQLGVAQGALRRAADFLAAREQFGRPLGTFQAVQHQLADCYIEIDALRVTLWQAVTDVEDGGNAAASVPVAQWWAAEGGLNVVHRVQHLHGGIGVDVDYPIHRYFLWGKQLAGTLGGASAHLARLGDALAGGGAP
ncbi:acyl-CoA dehydrogenase [Actinomadura craniellae]|uniref:Acyl-CoA dehydrogenase n=1 Tax=Actinomadura craniellae TaxID=2231787 RepID=A0A365H2P9_9ACTN|nr:acyl-CoA dehydrogenase family protein [Actinomadura craniellae]RAY13380.1 acyl-CoA dehydrogenase [Actinomadura craniellae]